MTQPPSSSPLSPLPTLHPSDFKSKDLKDLEWNQKQRLEISEMSDDEIRALIADSQTERVSPATRRAVKKRQEKTIKGLTKPIEFDLL